MSTDAAPSRRAALRQRDFRVLLVATATANLVLPLQLISLTFWAIDTYPDQKVLLSGLIVAVRGAGMLSFGLIGGAIADRFERRRVILACECAMLTTTVFLAACLLTMPFGDATVVAVLGLVFVFAVTMAIDVPSRTASIPVIVGRDQLGPAMGLFNVALQVTAPVSLPLVGFLVGAFGPDKVVAGSIAAWIIILPLIASLTYTKPPGDAPLRPFRPAVMIADIRSGLSYAARDRVILPVIAMVFVMQVVGMPGVGMLGPVWMTEILGLSRAQFGLIAMLWGMGALTGSFFLASRPALASKGMTLAFLVTLFGVGGIVFGHSRFVPLTSVANFGLGVAMAGTLLTSATIVQYQVAEEMRGRVMGLFPLVLGISMLNVGPVSAAGQAVGLPVVVPSLEWVVLALALAIVFLSPALRRAEGDGGRSGGSPPESPRVDVAAPAEA
ncbi:MAG: MFS transporter [Dehalococcoidia bacterium]|nr:MFS transporter [Dehalococcoidia bacterium]